MLFLFLALTSGAKAIETHDTRGLDVQVEAMPKPVSVDGVTMQVRLARGSDVPALARRIEQRWRLEGSAPRRMEAGGWQMLGRWEQGRNELIQWRGTGGAAQLIFSLLDTLQQSSPPGRSPFPLPPGCAWVRVIEDSEYSQRSAYCRLASERLRQAMRALLASQGWIFRHDTAASFGISRGTLSGSILLTPAPQPHHSALVWTTTGARPGSARQ